MADIMPPTPITAYPESLTEIEQVEIANALRFHFDDYECREELETQYRILCAVVERMIRRRTGGI